MTSTVDQGKRAAESAYREAQPWVVRLARWGYAAKGVVQTSTQQPYGPWLLGIVALGLMLYGVYSLVLARYRRIYAS